MLKHRFRRQARGRVSVPFNAGRGLMRNDKEAGVCYKLVSVPFNAGRGLMPLNKCLGCSATHEFQYPSMRVVD